MGKNGTLMQYFEWYLPKNMLWKKMQEQAKTLQEDGVSAVWIPPCYKGSGGVDDVGYAVYDIYDLGEFDQKGGIATKYGTKKELKAAIKELHNCGISVYADVVLDHMMGADEQEYVYAEEVCGTNRNLTIEEDRQIGAWTNFKFPGRAKKYSDFEWHWYHFTGIDWDEKDDEKGVFLFEGKEWEDEVDTENGNYDYLMGADVDLNNFEVISELTKWGKWFLQETDVDGFRFDAVKHMKFDFYKHWLDTLRREAKEELFSVGEYWNPKLDALKKYIDANDGSFSLFDVPLHYNFLNAATTNGEYDMRKVFDGTLVKDNPVCAVTFVDNHDTQPSQALESFIPDWFKTHAYALILLREQGYPCVFYGDYYGIEHSNVCSKQKMLRPLLRARKERAYGAQHDYLDHPDIIGFTREGSEEHEKSAVAVILTNAKGGTKRMYVNKNLAGSVFYDCLGNRNEEIVIQEDGSADFYVNDGSVSVWIIK